MCAIAAYSSPKRAHWAAFIRVLRESRVRGLHAFGFAWRNAVGNVRAAHFLSFEEMLAQLELVAPWQCIVHCRYSTSGDYRVLANNQPILRANAALAFNGVVDMGTKAEMEARWGVTLQTENDGEILLAKNAEDPFAMVPTLRGSFAGVLLSQGGVSAIRNARRPAYIARLGEGDGAATLVASTRDIFRRAGIETAAPLPPGKVVHL